MEIDGGTRGNEIDEGRMKRTRRIKMYKEEGRNSEKV